jgi:gliding motility-associated-like protein
MFLLYLGWISFMFRIAIAFFGLLLVLVSGNMCRGQASACPPNIDFEQGSLGFWDFSVGTCCPINISGVSGPVFSRHDLTFGPQFDQYGKFPVVAPGGGNYSLKLGNNSTQAQAERARYYVQVPSAPGKYVFLYRYAVVLQNPNHDPQDQPRFQVKAFDSLSGDVLPCSEHNYVASASMPGFLKSTLDSSVFYKSWTSATLDLSAFAGKTVGIDFATGDCALNGHFGYAYIDMNCGLFKIYTTQCNNSPDATLLGPPGFQSYRWTDVTFIPTFGISQNLTTPKPSVPAYYAVIVTPYPGFGCQDTFYTEYNLVNDNISANVADISICRDNSGQLYVNTANVNGPFIYQWWPSSGLSCDACSSPVANPIGSTTYYVSVENKYGCRDTASATVDVMPRPLASAGKDTTDCIGAQVQLTGTGGVSYKWSPAIALDDPASATPKATVGGYMQYFLVVTAANGCTDTDEVKITPLPQPSADAGSDSLLCKGAEIFLNGKGGGTYKWYPETGLSDPNIAGPLVSIKTDITYALIVSNGQGCTDTDYVSFIASEPVPFRAGNDTTICPGFPIQVFAEGGQSYYWSGENISDPYSDYPIVSPDRSAEYFVRIVDSMCNREDTLSVKITMHPVNQLRIVATDILCGAEVGQLTAYGGKSYAWSPSDNLEYPNAAVTKAYPRINTLYTLTGINSYGCPDTASAELHVYGDDGIFMPTAFSPNGDGLNDCFRPVITGNINHFEIFVYNRWGEMVFHANDINSCWDGVYKGEKQDLGTYYYYYRASSPLCGDFMRKGDVHLLR